MPGFEADADKQEHDPDSRAGQTRLLLCGQVCPRRYQTTLTPLVRNVRSEVKERRLLDEYQAA
jgi:hypothetical protein